MHRYTRVWYPGNPWHYPALRVVITRKMFYVQAFAHTYIVWFI